MDSLCEQILALYRKVPMSHQQMDKMIFLTDEIKRFHSSFEEEFKQAKTELARLHIEHEKLKSKVFKKEKDV